MPESWEGVLILLAVTAITLAADWARRVVPPPRDPNNYQPPPTVDPDDYVPTRPKPMEPEENGESEWDEGGGEEDEGA